MKRRALPALAIALATALSAASQAAAWVTACDDALCLFRQEVAAPGGAGTSALFEILVDAEAAEASIVLTTPLGVALEPGVALDIGGKTIDAPIRVCHADGCRATTALDEPDFARLLTQPSIRIHYRVFGAAEDVALDLPLAGLVKAMTSQR